MQAPFRLTATEAIARLRSGTLSVEEYAQSLLKRIGDRDDAVGGWAFLDHELILRQARELDQVPANQRGLLHGVAIGVKDIIYTKDMPTRHNSPLFADAPLVREDAGSVAILRQAGALIFGKTTTTEFAATLKGPPRTRNPHDPARTPGGSSAGSGAVVGDYQVPLALGTQTGGSTIRPGSFCGVYAYKPTFGAITREGQKLYVSSHDTLGLYSRSVQDLELLADVFSLDQDHPHDGHEVSVSQGSVPPLHGLRFAMLLGPDWWISAAGTGTMQAMQKARQLLQEAGATVELVDLPAQFEPATAWIKCIMDMEGKAVFLPAYREAPTKMDQFLVDHVENKSQHTRAEHLTALDGIASLRPIFDEIANSYTAVLSPSVPDEATVGLENTGSSAFNRLWTAMHVPVVNVPGFKGEHGLPIGVSLLSGRFKDRHLLNICRQVGELFEAKGGWTREV